jgi:hypothetical protein
MRQLHAAMLGFLVGCAGVEPPDGPRPIDHPSPGHDGGDGWPTDLSAPDGWLPDQGVPADLAAEDQGLLTDQAASLDLGTPPDLAAGVDLSRAADLAGVDQGGCVALPESGTLQMSGALAVSTPRWHPPRAHAGCPAGALGSFASVAHHRVVLCNLGAQARAYELALDGVTEAPGLTLADPVLVIYAGAELPADVRACLAADDDGSPAGSGALVANLTVPAGGTIALIATAGSNTIFGSYRLRITAR